MSADSKESASGLAHTNQFLLKTADSKESASGLTHTNQFLLKIGGSPKVLQNLLNFHMGRQLLVKNLPKDVTKKEIRQMLYGFPVKKIQVIRSELRSSMAKVSLEYPEILEEWDENRIFLLRGYPVSVTPSRTETMLCVARLPMDYTEEQFTSLVTSYGKVNRHFLMMSEETGESKGYGFIEYSLKKCASRAKNMLDKKQIGSFTLICDWLDPNHVTFESLHSKCLYIDNLPPNLTDMSVFKRIFSDYNPVYCQIALNHGCLQDWGLVECGTWKNAENICTRRNGFNFGGHHIRITYWIPGVHAVYIYRELLNNTGPRTQSALFPSPSMEMISKSLINLHNKNPIFSHNIQNIIESQAQQGTYNNEALKSTANTKDIRNQLPLNLSLKSPPLPESISMAGTENKQRLDGNSSSASSMGPLYVHPAGFSRPLQPSPPIAVPQLHQQESSTHFNTPPPFWPEEVKKQLCMYPANPTHWQNFLGVDQAPLGRIPLSPNRSMGGWGIAPFTIPNSMMPLPMMQFMPPAMTPVCFMPPYSFPSSALLSPSLTPPAFLTPSPTPPAFLPSFPNLPASATSSTPPSLLPRSPTPPTVTPSPTPPPITPSPTPLAFPPPSKYPQFWVNPIPPSFGAPYIIGSQPSSQLTAPPNSTNYGMMPIGQKRRHVPEPEPTSINNYFIGQPSQIIDSQYHALKSRKLI